MPRAYRRGWGLLQRRAHGSVRGVRYGLYVSGGGAVNDREQTAPRKLCVLTSGGETLCVPVGNESELSDAELRERHAQMQRVLHESERVYSAHDIFRTTRAYLTVQSEMMARMADRLEALEAALEADDE